MNLRSAGGLLPLALFLGAFSLLPVAALLAPALLGPGGAHAAVAVLADPLDRQAIENSLLQGGASAGLATVLGYPAGVLLGRWEFPGRRVALALLPIPFLLPSLVMILGLTELLSDLGPLGAFSGSTAGLERVLLLNTLFNAPIVALLTATALASAPGEEEEAAALLGAGPARLFLRHWGPLSAVGAAAGAALTFVYSAFGFAAPLLLCGPRCYTIEDQVYVLVQVLAEPSSAARLAGWGLLLLLPLVVAYALLLAQLRTRAAGRARVLPPLSRDWRGAAPFLLGALLLLAAEASVLGSLLDAALTSRGGTYGWSQLFGRSLATHLGLSTYSAIGNSLLFAGLAAGIVLLLALSAGFALRAWPRASVPVDAMLFLPVLVSPVLLAFALANFWRPLIGGGNSVWFLIVVSQASAALPLAVPPLLRSLARLGRGTREAARTLGAARLSAYLDAELPQAARALGSTALLALAIGLGEFTSTYFLYLPRFTTLPVELYLLEGARLAALVPIAGALLLLVSLLVFAGAEIGGRRLVG
ncbi:MAG TPA: ABC transporter permease subunit [Thermoplasmata archaeon]|nr:ABC transporter permease subunit [Thermoplasmata archaeon]